MHGRRTATAVMAGLAVVGSLLTATSADAAAKKADLVTSRVGTPPAAAKPGGSFRIDATVANRGRADAAPSSSTFYLSKDRVAGAGDARGATVPVKRVPAGGSRSVGAKVKVPGDARGKYWVIACADSAAKVGETKESNNCTSSKSQVEVGGVDSATLTGELTFLDEGSEADGAATESWHRTGSAQINFDIHGDLSGDPTFESVESMYDRHGTESGHDETDYCVYEREREEAGTGELVYEGDPYTDDIFGHFTKTDLSGVRVGLFMRADWTETTTRTGRGEFPCESSSSTTTGTGLIVTDIELVKESATANEIHYRVKSWLGDMSTPSVWDRVEGELTLTLGGAGRPAVLAKPKPKKKPNLGVVGILQAPAQVRVGAEFGVKVMVANQGMAPARASQVSVHLSRDPKKSAGDPRIGRAAVGNLDIASVDTVPADLTLPSSARGTYYLIACADAARKVPETRENDNCNASATTVEVVDPIQGVLTGTLELYSGDETQTGNVYETWGRLATAEISMLVSGRGDAIRIVDDGSSYTWGGDHQLTVAYPECKVDDSSQEEGADDFLKPGQSISDLHGSTEDPMMEQFDLSLQMEYAIVGTITSCGTDPVPYTSETEYTTGLGLQQVSRTDDAITYEVVGDWTGQGEGSQWDTIEGTLRLELD